MKESEEIINKVASSGLITIDLEEYYPKQEVIEMDIKNYLYEGIILKEKDFRKYLDDMNWADYRDKILAVYCSEDAIIPKWAYMLVSMHALPYTTNIFFGNKENAIEESLLNAMRSAINPSEYIDKRVVIKGCGDKNISERIYMEVTQRLLPVVKSLMYGEPCSTVPIYKKTKA